MKQKQVVRLAVLAMLAAIAVVMMFFIHIPFPPAPFLKFDMADIPILLGTMMFGILPGLAILLITSLIQAFAVSADGWVGLVMHFVASGALVMLVGLFHKWHYKWSETIIGMVLGTVAMTAVMIPMNLILTPLFMGAPVQAVIDLLPAIITFNLLKAGLNCFVTALLFKALTPFAKKNPYVFGTGM